MSALIRIDEVPAADRLEFIQGITSATWVPMECRSEYQADYRGEFRVSGLGAMRMVVLDIMPITVRRTPGLISRADPDMLKLLLVCGRGCSVVEQDGRQARLSASDFAIYNTRRPYEVVCGAGLDQPTRLLTFMFSPSLLPLSPSLVRRLAAVRIPAATGLGELTSQFLLQLARNIAVDRKRALTVTPPPRMSQRRSASKGPIPRMTRLPADSAPAAQGIRTESGP